MRLRTTLLPYFILFAVADQKLITAKFGQNVTLTCRAPNNNILVGKWSRADLGDEYVLLYRDEQFVLDNQHPSFKNRVDLQDRQMKDGDVSLILKDVTINDAGTYECCIVMTETRSWKSISIISLRVVVPPGQTGGDTEDGGKEDGGKKDGVSRGRYGLIASFLLLPVFIAAFFVVAKLQRRTLSKDLPSVEPAASCSETIVSLR